MNLNTESRCLIMKVEKMLQLEKSLFDMDAFDIEMMVASGSLNAADCDYLTLALKLPWRQISRKLKMYDDSLPKMDELRFVKDLCEEYQVERNVLIERIHQVRKLDLLVEKSKEKKNNTNLVKKYRK